MGDVGARSAGDSIGAESKRPVAAGKPECSAKAGAPPAGGLGIRT
jgi:hypothetical protein